MREAVSPHRTPESFHQGVMPTNPLPGQLKPPFEPNGLSEGDCVGDPPALAGDVKGLRVGLVRHFYESDNPANEATRQAIAAAIKGDAPAALALVREHAAAYPCDALPLSLALAARVGSLLFV